MTVESLSRRPTSSLRAQAKQSGATKQGLDCFVARAPRNDGGVCVRIPATRCARVLQIRSPQKIERAQGRPGARCTRGLMCKCICKKTHMSIQVQRKQSGLPCAMALRLISCSPRRDQSLLVTVARKKRELLENLTPAIGASGPHDFAVRFSHARQSQLWRPSLPDPRFVTNAHTPLWWDGMAKEVKLICLRDQA
jgi:hypothetical protein